MKHIILILLLVNSFQSIGQLGSKNVVTTIKGSTFVSGFGTRDTTLSGHVNYTTNFLDNTVFLNTTGITKNDTVIINNLSAGIPNGQIYNFKVIDTNSAGKDVLIKMAHGNIDAKAVYTLVASPIYTATAYPTLFPCVTIKVDTGSGYIMSIH